MSESTPLMSRLPPPRFCVSPYPGHLWIAEDKLAEGGHAFGLRRPQQPITRSPQLVGPDRASWG